LLSGPGNPISFLALAMSVPAVFVLFWRLPAKKAVFMTFFGSAMFLPCVVGFDLPVFPDFDKEILPGMAALVAAVALRRKALKSPPFGGPEALLIAMVFGAFGTVLTNQDPIVHGPATLPAQSFYDGIVDSCDILMRWFPPYFLGRSMFRTRKDLRQLCRWIVFAGLIYTLPIFVELRLSPQMHNWIYGFHQSDFIQTIRWGGYRPKVFMRHGLNVALFMTVTVLIAMAMWKAKVGLGWTKWATPRRVFAYLFVVLLFCKSTGAYFYLMGLAPILWFAPQRIQRLTLIAMVSLILGYPMIRQAGWVPVDAITDWMTQLVGEERALSLWFRMFTEEQVMENARDRFVFGWGGYGRPYEFDAQTGLQTSVLDGFWVIEIGRHGLVGFFCLFGMMLWPVITVARKLPAIENDKDRILLGALGFCCALYVFDWIPNAAASLELTFMTGALAGLIRGVLEEEQKRKKAERRRRRQAAMDGADADRLPREPVPEGVSHLHST